MYITYTLHDRLNLLCTLFFFLNRDTNFVYEDVSLKYVSAYGTCGPLTCVKPFVQTRSMEFFSARVTR